MDLEIRAAKPSDVDALLALQEGVHQFCWERQAWLKELDRPQSLVWIVDDGASSEPVGYLVAWRVVDAIELVDLSVAPEMRGQQIASAMVQTLIALAGANSVARIALEVRSENRGAINFYKKLGFHFVGRQRGYYEDGECARLMQRWIHMS